MHFPLIIAALAAKASAEQFQNAATEKYLEGLNRSLGLNYLWALLGVIAVVFSYRNFFRFYAHTRHIASLGHTGSQKFFALSSPTLNSIKDHLLYAPLLHYRRATDIKFSKHINFGKIPSRFQSIFITLFIIFNIFACTWNIPWHDPQLEVLPILRNRTGTLAVTNLIPIVIMSTIKNPLILALDISYDTFNLLHRWLGRLAILQGIAHSLSFIIAKVQSKEGWAGLKISLSHQFIYAGLTAVIGFTILFFSAPKLVRSWAYEVFHHVHIVVVAVTFSFLYLHLKDMPQVKLLLTAIIAWVLARSWRATTLIYRSWGRESSTASIEALPGDALRIILKTPRPWKFQPGQSIYLTIPSVSWWTAHPFSVAWNEIDDPLSRSDSTKSNMSFEKRHIVTLKEPQAEQGGKQTFGLIVKARNGMTQKLLSRVEKAGGVEGVQLSFNALIEGPYGTQRSLASYGTVMLFASGVGITHQIPYVKSLIDGYNDGSVASRRITLVWVIPSTDMLEWVRPWMHEILGIENRRDVLKVVLYITRAGLSQPIRSPSETVRMLRGRPDVEAIMRKEASEKMGCMGVSVCAGGGLSDEVRRVSRVLLGRGVNLDFVEEGYGW